MRVSESSRLARFLLRQIVLGMLAAAAFVAGLVLTDPGGIGELLRHDAAAPWPMLALWGVAAMGAGTMAGVLQPGGLDARQGPGQPGLRALPARLPRNR